MKQTLLPSRGACFLPPPLTKNNGSNFKQNLVHVPNSLYSEEVETDKQNR